MDDTKKVTIEIWGGFHNQLDPIRVKVPQFAADKGINCCLEHLSDRTRAKVRRHMCGIKDCMCGAHHGWEYEIV